MWPEILFVAVGIIDKTLIRISILKRELQILGITALHILTNKNKSTPELT
jgi:hypothetical protein